MSSPRFKTEKNPTTPRVILSVSFPNRPFKKRNTPYPALFCFGFAAFSLGRVKGLLLPRLNFLGLAFNLLPPKLNLLKRAFDLLPNEINLLVWNLCFVAGRA